MAKAKGTKKKKKKLTMKQKLLTVAVSAVTASILPRLEKAVIDYLKVGE
jgi:hypothetical protein